MRETHIPLTVLLGQKEFRKKYGAETGGIDLLFFWLLASNVVIHQLRLLKFTYFVNHFELYIRLTRIISFEIIYAAKITLKPECKVILWQENRWPEGASNTNRGPAGAGAVDWLQLQDKGGSIGIAEVYKVVTAGGAAPTICTTTGVVTVPYAAEYWFYDNWVSLEKRPTQYRRKSYYPFWKLSCISSLLLYQLLKVFMKMH